MIREALELIQDTAVDSAEARSIEVPEIDRRLIFRGKEQVASIDLPRRRSSVAADFDSFVAAVREYHISGTTIWVGAASVIAVIGTDALARDCIRLPLLETAARSSVFALTARPKFGQSELITWLRVKMAETNLPAFANAFRVLDFTKAESARGSVQKNGESLGRSIEVAVQQAADLPEQMICDFRWFNTLGLTMKAQAKIIVDVDARQQCIWLAVSDDELAIQQQAAALYVRDQLVRAFQAIEGLSKVPVFLGTPTK